MFKYKAEIWFYLGISLPILSFCLERLGYMEGITEMVLAKVSEFPFAILWFLPLLCKMEVEEIKTWNLHIGRLKELLIRLSGNREEVEASSKTLYASYGELYKELEDEISFIEKERNSSKFNVFKAALAKTSGNLEAWKDASGDMARLAFECGKQGPKKRTRNDLNNLCKRLNIELTPGQLEEVRKALPDEYVDRQNRAGISH